MDSKNKINAIQNIFNIFGIDPRKEGGIFKGMENEEETQ